MRLTASLLAAALACLPALATAASDAAACGVPEGKCPVATGFYRLALPPGHEGPVPAVVFLHGYGGSSMGTMRNTGMLKDLFARGYALVAPEAVPISAANPKRSWAIANGRPHARDDVAYLRQVLDDAAKHGIDRGRILLAGFSVGGSMVWDAACQAPDMARAYAAISGAFWEPMPAKCAGPVDMFHTHGWTDRVVPLEGRTVGKGYATQGDVFASLAILRAADRCRSQMPDSIAIEDNGKRWIRHWTSCPGGEIDLMLHTHGHMIPRGWTERALDWFEAREAAR